MRPPAASETAPTGGEPALSLPHVLAFVLFWALAHTMVALVQRPEVLAGQQVDPDGYVRLMRVELLLGGQSWFDGSIPRSNWPYGESNHWTRPLDVLLAGLALPLIPLLGVSQALVVAGAVSSPLLNLAACLALVWTVHPILPGPERTLAAPALLAQPVVLAYSSVGHADHHPLTLLLFILALGAGVRAFLRPESFRHGVAAGALSGLGVWVSPEALLPLAFLLATGGLIWIRDGARRAGANLGLGVGLLGAVAVALVIERPPAEWLIAEFDRVSVAHLTLAALVVSFWLVVPRIATAREGAPSVAEPPRRLVAGLGGALALLLTLLTLFPGFTQGPWAGMDPEMARFFNNHTEELQPLFPRSTLGLGRFIMNLGGAVVLLPFALYLLVREWRGARSPVWLLVFLSLSAYTVLAGLQARMGTYPNVIVAILSVELLRRVLPAAGRIESAWGRSGVRVGLMAGVLLGMTLAGGVVGRLAARGNPEALANADNPCAVSTVVGYLADPMGPFPEPRTILAFMTFGPELIGRTHHRVLAGPYHRSEQGIRAHQQALISSDMHEVRSIIDERDISLILLCPPQDEFYFGIGPNESLYRQLTRGTLPPWIRRHPMPEQVAGPFLLFEVVEEGRGT